MTTEQKLKFADYILNWLKEENLFEEGRTCIDLEQVEETCMAGSTICEALAEAKVIDGIGC